MADFCKQCAEEIFGEGTPSDFIDCDNYEIVLCEGCGAIQVNSRGECISDDCLKGHNNTEIGEKLV